uniref:Uncharacterized protein n=1 Tax=Anguilla anguilla TaxID=7936 RepID=A0A0E9X1F5_ANGAN
MCEHVAVLQLKCSEPFWCDDNVPLYNCIVTLSFSLHMSSVSPFLFGFFFFNFFFLFNSLHWKV